MCDVSADWVPPVGTRMVELTQVIGDSLNIESMAGKPKHQNGLVKGRRIHSAHSSEVPLTNHAFLVQCPVHALHLNRRIAGSVEKKLERTTQETDRQKEPTFTITKLIDDDVFKHTLL